MGRNALTPNIVTVSNHASAKELKHKSTKTVFAINTAMLLIAGFLMVYYVIQANIIAASNYKINALSQQLESLNEIRGSLAAQKSSMEDLGRVLSFALSQNMVEAKNAVYLFENGDVALGK
jgi:hypothetical protein